MTKQDRLKLMVLSSLFPNSREPNAGLFVKERMFRVGEYCDLFVVSPKPWSPFDKLIRLLKPHYRIAPIEKEFLENKEIHFPRFFALPGIGRRFDGYFMAKAVKRYIETHDLVSSFDHIDAHFSYPDGYAGGLLKSWLQKSLTITMRGTEVPHSMHVRKRALMLQAWHLADRVICVSNSLKKVAEELGAKSEKFTVIGNGVDTEKFLFSKNINVREQLSIAKNAKVLITVGGLVPRKGFHRVIKVMPQVMRQHQDLHYIIIGGGTAEGNNNADLVKLAEELNLQKRVHFVGKKSPGELKEYLSTADLFVLLSTNEGWANVILEAMACEIPVLASDVGGNKEVVATTELGKIIALDDETSLVTSLNEMLTKSWSSQQLRQYALENSWQDRVEKLLNIFKQIKGIN